MSTPVGVNLLWCVPGDVGGSEEYLVRQLLGLAALPAERAEAFELVLFVPRGFPEAHPDVASAFRTVVAPTDGRRRSTRIGLESTWLTGQTRNRRLRLVHHAGGTVPVVRAATPIVTVHDLQYLTYPHYFGLSRLTYLRSAVPFGVRRAASVTVPSGFVRRSVAEAFAYPPERIVVVPHGLEPGVGAALAPEDDLRRRYGLGGPYVVYPAVTHPHKDHVVLLQAFAVLRRRWPELRLVLPGGRGRAEAAVVAEIERLDVGDAVIRPGRVPDADRDALVAHADVLAFPSRYEGFGAPLLEAMHLGTPVVAADATAVPEVVGEAGLLVAPADADALAEGVERVLADPVLSATLRQAGRARAATFTARRSASRLLDAYRLALS